MERAGASGSYGHPDNDDLPAAGAGDAGRNHQPAGRLMRCFPSGRGQVGRRHIFPHQMERHWRLVVRGQSSATVLFPESPTYLPLNATYAIPSDHSWGESEQGTGLNCPFKKRIQQPNVIRSPLCFATPSLPCRHSVFKKILLSGATRQATFAFEEVIVADLGHLTEHLPEAHRLSSALFEVAHEGIFEISD